MVRPDRVPQMADAEELILRLPSVEGVQFTALYLNQKGFQRAEATGRLSNKGWLYSSPSESFLKANNNITIAESLLAVRDWAASFRAVGKGVHGLMISTAFACEYEGNFSVSKVMLLIEKFMAECGSLGETIHEVCLADTVGRADPLSVRQLVSGVSSLGPSVSLHLHDTWGLALSNAYAGLEAGVRIFESSVGGLGGCPFTAGSAGNVATEDLVYLFDSLGVFSGIDVSKMCYAAEFAEAVVGHPLAGHIYKTKRQRESR
jgi:hydroxymethylglutaryl-CoA lyase